MRLTDLPPPHLSGTVRVSLSTPLSTQSCCGCCCCKPALSETERSSPSATNQWLIAQDYLQCWLTFAGSALYLSRCTERRLEQLATSPGQCWPPFRHSLAHSFTQSFYESPFPSCFRGNGKVRRHGHTVDWASVVPITHTPTLHFIRTDILLFAFCAPVNWHPISAPLIDNSVLR